MHDLLALLNKLVAEVIAGSETELVDLEVKGGKNNPVIRVFLDEPGGISIDRCVALSRDLTDLIDMQDFLLRNYRLEVSSPGIDRPLKSRRDFERNIGREVDITYTASPDDQQHKQAIGEIVAVQAGPEEQEQVVLKTKKTGELKIDISSIIKALIRIKWS